MQESSFEASLRNRFRDRNPEGCSPEEIASLEATLQLRLPDDYRAFLAVAGRGDDSLWYGSDYAYGYLFDMQESARELLEPVGLTMPEGSFVFHMHQGYQFFFLCEEGVFYFLEGKASFEYRCRSFTEFFESAKAWP